MYNSWNIGGNEFKKWHLNLSCKFFNLAFLREIPTFVARAFPEFIKDILQFSGGFSMFEL